MESTYNSVYPFPKIRPNLPPRLLPQSFPIDFPQWRRKKQLHTYLQFLVYPSINEKFLIAINEYSFRFTSSQPTTTTRTRTTPTKQSILIKKFRFDYRYTSWPLVNYMFSLSLSLCLSHPHSFSPSISPTTPLYSPHYIHCWFSPVTYCTFALLK